MDSSESIHDTSNSEKSMYIIFTHEIGDQKHMLYI